MQTCLLVNLEHLSLLSLRVQAAWVGWMDKMSEFVVDPKQRFSDIIVPTMDTVRGSYLIGLLLESSKQVGVEGAWLIDACMQRRHGSGCMYEMECVMS